MDWKEYQANNRHFTLSGGPFDGERVATADLYCWPSFLRFDNYPGVSVYQMRIGDLDHYDYVGEESSAHGPVFKLAGGDQ